MLLFLAVPAASGLDGGFAGSAVGGEGGSRRYAVRRTAHGVVQCGGKTDMG